MSAEAKATLVTLGAFFILICLYFPWVIIYTVGLMVLSVLGTIGGWMVWMFLFAIFDRRAW